MLKWSQGNKQGMLFFFSPGPEYDCSQSLYDCKCCYITIPCVTRSNVYTNTIAFFFITIPAMTSRNITNTSAVTSLPNYDKANWNAVAVASLINRSILPWLIEKYAVTYI